jgi:tetratricopeptide (TPR) repeat protein
MMVCACSWGTTTVVRSVNGRTIEGRFINDTAYALYARGALLEAQGDLQAASLAYARALDEDPDSAELWTRLGAVRCKSKRSDAWQAFERASAIDPEYEPLWSEKATCHLAAGQLALALGEAKTAVRLDPNRVATSLLVISIYEKSGRGADAGRWLYALAVRSPQSVMVYRAMRDFALRHADRVRERQTREGLAGIDPESAPGFSDDDARRMLKKNIDDALIGADVDRALKFAVLAHVAPGEVALRAAALGGAETALTLARRLLAADPSNADAWVAALVSLDLLRQKDAFQQMLATWELVGPPGALGARLFAALLERRVDAGAAQTWLAAYGPLPTEDLPGLGAPEGR